MSEQTDLVDLVAKTNAPVAPVAPADPLSAEREACARIADGFAASALNGAAAGLAMAIAELIRGRSDA